jgi:hypothetical protein
MEGDDPVVVGFFVEAEGATLDQVIGHFADVLRYRVAWIEVVKRADQRVPEAVGHTPGMATFADHDTFDAQFQRRFAHPHRDLAHLLVVADEHAKVARLRRMRTQRPADAGGVEDLGVADQAFDVGLGEEVGRRGDQQYLGALDVQRELDVQAGVVLGVFFQAFAVCSPAPGRVCPGCCRCGAPCR